MIIFDPDQGAFHFESGGPKGLIEAGIGIESAETVKVAVRLEQAMGFQGKLLYPVSRLVASDMVEFGSGYSAVGAIVDGIGRIGEDQIHRLIRQIRELFKAITPDDAAGQCRAISSEGSQAESSLGRR